LSGTTGISAFIEMILIRGIESSICQGDMMHHARIMLFVKGMDDIGEKPLIGQKTFDRSPSVS
jgi:hypothetical protein